MSADAWVGAGCLAGAVVLYFLYGKKQNKAGPSGLVSSVLGQPAFLPVARPKNQLPIKSGAELIAFTGCTGMLEVIRTRMGFSQDNFNTDVLPLLHAYAEYVQLLPASESHHHAQPGGLLQHTLEVACAALQLRNGYKLPVGGTPEDQIRLGAVWTFGVLCAALLHDIGKPVSDVDVTLYGAHPERAESAWSGLAGSMCQYLEAGASHYTVNFPLKKDYTKHQALGATLLHALVPAKAMRWLGTDAGLVDELLAYLEGRGSDSILREIVSKADQHSVAENLKTGSRTRFTSARSAPLIERLMQGLRTLLAEGHLAVNRPGAPVFVDPDGVHVWIVAGTCADQVRKLLEQRESSPDGMGQGVPTDNTRLFDTWLEYGALIQPPKEFGKGSVWWVKVQIEDWSHVLTMLKFPIEGLYASGVTRPGVMQGALTPVAPSSARSTTAETHETATVAVLPDVVPSVEPPPSLGDGNPAQSHLSLAEDALPLPPVAMPSIKDVQEEDVGDFLEEKESAVAVRVLDPVQTSGVPDKAVQPLQIVNRPSKAQFRLPNSTPKPNADAFIAWIQRGLGTGDLPYNESDAVIHFVPEGMAIISPRAFRLYLESNEFIGDLGQNKDEMRAIQNEMQKAGYLYFNKAEKSYFHWYRTQRDDGSTGATITVYLINNPQAYIRPVPAVNEMLVRTDGKKKTSE